ncbi:MAG: antitoxin Xre-like helix-turn-helix domain-containing protein, partial [Pseudomonadota bacterium]
MLIERTKTAHDPTAVEITDSEAMAMARAALNLFSKWGLSDSEARALLGGVSSSTYNRWKTGSIGR